MAVKWWASAKLCGVEQRAPPVFGRAIITLGIGPHSSCSLFCFTFNFHLWPLSACPPPSSSSKKVFHIHFTRSKPFTIRKARCYFPSLWTENSPVCHFCPSTGTDKSGKLMLFSVPANTQRYYYTN